MNKIFEALKKLLPADQVREVAKAVEDMVAEEVARLEAEYNQKLTEAYDSVSDELQAAEATAEEGYKQAYGIINDLMVRLENVNEEWENVVEEEYEKAWGMIQAAEAKNENLEVQIYEEFEGKLKQMRDFMVDKVDQFLQLQNAEIYEHARRDVLNDPRLVEHKVALDKIVEVASQYLSEDDFAGATSARLADTQKAVEDLKGHLRVLEARNVRLSTQNTKLNEAVRELSSTLNESTRVERTERARTAKNASGRGNRALGRGEQILAEYNANVPANRSDDQEQNIVESNDVLNDLLVLSGLQESN